MESKVRKKVIRLRYFPLAAIERGPRRFRNTRGRRRRPKGARTAADIIRFLAGAKLATTSGLTGGLPQLWTRCQYAVKAGALGRNLTVLEKHHVRLQFPPPPNINFAGAT